MVSHRAFRKSVSIVGGAAVATLLSTFPAYAGGVNLLVNPGFESPAAGGTTSTIVTGWTPFIEGELVRATFNQNNATHPTPDTSDWGLWGRTFVPFGSGGYQDVSNITAGATYDLTGYMLFEANFPAIVDPVTARLSLTFLDSGSNPVGTPTILDVAPQDNPATLVWSQYQLSAVAPVGASKVRVFAGTDGGGATGGGISAFIDNLFLEGPGAPPTNFWVADASGDWNVTGNWAIGIPNAIDAQADFLGAITTAQTVFTNSPVTIGAANFDNANTYVIAGAGSLTVQSSGTAAINVLQGNHKINVPTRFASNTNVTVTGGSLNMADPVTIANGVTVNTSGNVQFNAPLTVESAGVLAFGSNGRLFGAPSLATGAKVDIKTNSVVLDYNGPASPIATIRSQVASGYNGGTWDGGGIVSSNGNASTHGVGYGEATDVAAPAGQSVDDTSIVLRYTRYGDANLDGLVNLADFNRLAGNFGATNAFWSQGDFNYDGLVNLADFNRLAANFGLQATGTDAPTPEDWSNLAAAVPEPTSLGLFAAAMAGCLVRRQSRRSVR